MNNLYNAMEATIRITEYHLEGVVTADPDDEPIWYVYFRTPSHEDENENEPETPDVSQELEIEIIVRDGGIVASVMTQHNIKNRELTTIMNTLLEHIKLPEEEPDPEVN